MTFAWTPDEYGTLMLPSPDNGKSWNIWIQGRRPYCDRGHWEWGYTGVPGMHSTPDVSYYFMRQTTAQAEMEEWLHRRLNGNPVNKGKIAQLGADDVKPQHALSQEHGWKWKVKNEKLLEFKILHEGKSIVGTLKEKKADTGRYWTFDLNGVEVDHSDCFPRSYLILEHALQEVEEFFVWRLLKNAIEIPGLITGSPRPVGNTLEEALIKDDQKRPKVTSIKEKSRSKYSF